MPHRNQKIFDEGWQAWTDGADAAENPYPPGKLTDADEYGAWYDGWRAAEEDYWEQKAERDEYGDRVDYEHDRNR
jgi:hypothetical protein